MSREEMQKIRKDMIENSRTSLENVVYQDVMGANQLRTNPFKYGEYGLGAGERKYESFSQDEKIRKMKDDIFAQRQNRGKALGVYGEPVYPTNYDISLNIAEQVEQHKQIVPLKVLEEIVTGLAGDMGFSFTVPEHLKSISMAEISMKQQPGAKLTEKENEAIAVYQRLSDAYNRAVALRIAQPGYFSDINEFGRKLTEKYAPKKRQEG